MFPAPTTIAISTPRSWSSATSSAMRSTSWRSTPYSLSPINASPESFSSTRWKAGLPLGELAGKGEAAVVEHLELMLLERLRDGLARVVDPVLVRQDGLTEEALGKHPLDDLFAMLLGPRLHVGELREDLPLGLQILLGDLAAVGVERRREGDVHREKSRNLRRAPCFHQDADLVRRRVDVRGDHLVVPAFEAGRAGHDDVLAELGHKLLAL